MMADANAGVYVGVAIFGIILVIVVCLLVAVCCFKSKRKTKHQCSSTVKQLQVDTKAIKSKAKKLKTLKRRGWSCCCLTHSTETSQGNIEPPLGLHVRYVDVSSVLVTWKLPSNYPTGVKVHVFKRRSLEQDGWKKLGTVSHSNLQYRIRHLDPEEHHHIGVVAKYRSQKSKLLERELNFIPPEPPGVPTDFRTTSQPDSVLLTWRPPLNSGLSAIMVYDVLVKDRPDATWTSLTRVKPNVNQMSYRVKNKITWQRPVFRLAAENARGKGPYTEGGPTTLKHIQGSTTGTHQSSIRSRIKNTGLTVARTQDNVDNPNRPLRGTSTTFQQNEQDGGERQRMLQKVNKRMSVRRVKSTNFNGNEKYLEFPHTSRNSTKTPGGIASSSTLTARDVNVGIVGVSMKGVTTDGNAVGSVNSPELQEPPATKPSESRELAKQVETKSMLNESRFEDNERIRVPDQANICPVTTSNAPMTEPSTADTPHTTVTAVTAVVLSTDPVSESSSYLTSVDVDSITTHGNQQDEKFNRREDMMEMVLKPYPSRTRYKRT